MSDNNEAQYYHTLKRIASYQSVASLRRYSERDYGINAEYAVEMAYENVISEAKLAIRGKRRPKP